MLNMSMNRIICIFSVVTFMATPSHSSFKSESVFLKALKDVGFDRIFIVPATTSKITFHELDHQRGHISTNASPYELIQAGVAERITSLDYFEDPSKKHAYRAYQVTEVMVCYRSVHESGGIMLGRVSQTESFDWVQCILFPQRIQTVVESLRQVQNAG